MHDLSYVQNKFISLQNIELGYAEINALITYLTIFHAFAFSYRKLQPAMNSKKD